MSSRVLRRRSATAAWIYVAVACGIAGSIVAARVLGLDDFGVFATALVVVGFFQTLLDLTVEESLTKYGFRYVAGAGLGASASPLPAGAAAQGRRAASLATLSLVALAPFADEIFDADGLEQALLAACAPPARPVVRERRGDGAAPAQPLRPARASTRRDRPALRLLAIVIAAPMGVTEALVAIVIAQAISTIVISVVGVVALRRFPSAPAKELGEDVRGDPLVRRPVEHRDRRHLAAHDARSR